jgi:type I site-specific restriction endonuclease
MLTANQNPEQIARDQIDRLLIASGWLVQSFKQKNIAAGVGVAKQAGTLKYTSEEQVQWLRMIKDYIANTFHVDKDDFELYPFNKQGGLGKMWQLFGEETDAIINELNESLVA